MTRLRGGLRVQALVAGTRYVERVPSAAVAAHAARTLISTRLASEVSGAPGPSRCSRAAVVRPGLCGLSAPVAVALPSCRAVKVRAVEVPMPRGADLVIGRDVLDRLRRGRKR